MTAYLLQIAALLLVCAGLWWIFPPAALIVVGVFVGLLGAAMERDSLKKPGG